MFIFDKIIMYLISFAGLIFVGYSLYAMFGSLMIWIKDIFNDDPPA